MTEKVKIVQLVYRCRNCNRVFGGAKTAKWKIKQDFEKYINGHHSEIMPVDCHSCNDTEGAYGDLIGYVSVGD